MNISIRRLAACWVVVAGFGLAASGQEQTPIKFKTTRLADSLYWLQGAGGNILACCSDRGVLLVDSEYKQLTEKLVAAVAESCKGPIRLVVNTHTHFDHVGGNEALAKDGALILAHENVRKRMGSEQFLAHIDHRQPPYPAAALPIATYADAMKLHWGEEEIEIVHVEAAHTDGDSLVYFRRANVLHTGDTCFAGMYPYIDVRGGGSIDGMIQAIDRALAMTNAQTRIIPGHGPLSTPADLGEYRKMLATSRDRVQALIREGKSRKEVLAGRPTSDLDERWGRGGFGPDQWVSIVYDSLTASEASKTKPRRGHSPEAQKSGARSRPAEKEAA